VERRHVLQEPEWIIRFGLSQRVQHAVLLAGFVVLVITGLPQKYTDWPLATWTINQLGGIDNARFIHRSAAVALVLASIYHILEIGFWALRGRLRPTMVPNLKDVVDAMTTLRYSLGLAPAPPKFDRYEYRQKFEYWGVVFGTVVIICTGLILWFPIAFTKLFPGEMVAAAREAHGGEATLALLTIVVWHLYSVLLSPGQFPGDFSIFTGRISKERMEEEHPLEYARLQGKGGKRESEPAAAGPPPERPRRFLRWRSPRGSRAIGGRRGPR
jgi:cytochrome b subunit of formate dehydrogenase